MHVMGTYITLTTILTALSLGHSFYFAIIGYFNQLTVRPKKSVFSIFH